MRRSMGGREGGVRRRMWGGGGHELYCPFYVA